MASKLRRVRKYSRDKRIGKHGFRKRMETAGGRAVLSRRRQKGRKQLTPQRA
ncbi:MAG: 50S ribosomal protein L34 [candidate division SR1 bacterium]|nr:50S ribosomal protein L34 [candidate division SR1 bacterium]